ncbi:MAG TPA: glycosyltransferase family 39 protein [Ktedonobacteraceae bacterium]|nr:glycosyltransferase family 39 protein [Ktedonobacteraceae bacterium]
MKLFAKRLSLITLDPPQNSPSGAEENHRISTGVGAENAPEALPTFRQKWLEALKQVFPIYFAAHLAVFIIDYLAVLFAFTMPYQFYGSHYQFIKSPRVSILLTSWNMWPHDTSHYIEIAQSGYDHSWLAAFFPFYPLLMHIVSYVTGNDYLIAALLISNIAGLIMLVVFYQLVKELFDHERALRTVLYFSIFPSAFFFMAGYTETTFLCFVLLCFYEMHNRRWWLAGLFGLFAALTRNTGIFLVIPFCFEYLRQHQFRLKTLRWDVLSVALIPAGLVIFMLYTYITLGDPLAFQHAQAYWHHIYVFPLSGLVIVLQTMINSHALLSFVVARNAIEIGTTTFIVVLLVLGLVGPWRFPRAYLAYFIFAAIVWSIPLFAPIRPITGPLPYQSLSRYMLAVFPAFIVLAMLGKHRIVHYTYLMVAGALFFFLLTQFLLGYMIT